MFTFKKFVIVFVVLFAMMLTACGDGDRVDDHDRILTPGPFQKTQEAGPAQATANAVYQQQNPPYVVPATPTPDPNDSGFPPTHCGSSIMVNPSENCPTPSGP